MVWLVVNARRSRILTGPGVLWGGQRVPTDPLAVSADAAAEDAPPAVPPAPIEGGGRASTTKKRKRGKK